MKETAFKKIYNTAITVMVISVLLLPLVKGVAPFSTSLAWSEQGLGSSLVLLQNNAAVSAGEVVAGRAETLGGVKTYTVRDAYRKDGSYYYEVAGNTQTDEVVSIMAGTHGQEVLFSVPLFGAWIQMLVHPFGIFLLVGLPLTMMVLNMGTLFVRRLLPTLSMLEMRAAYVKRMKKTSSDSDKRKTDMNPSNANAKPHNMEDEFITVLKPFNQHNYSI